MRKKWLFLMLSIVLCFALAFSLSACGKDEGGEQNPQEEEGLLTIAGVSFEDKTVDYSGSEQSITVSGLPEDASVAYTANTGTNAGVYYATAVITKEGYKTLTLQATLTINKLTFTGVTFQNVSVVYDNNEHTISVAGVPNFANVTYTGTRTAKNAGTYNSTAKVTADNYHDLTLTATLTISKATLGDFTFNSSTFEYDTQKHIISISGLVPSGETVVYSGGEDGANGATNVGTYTITAVIGGKNYLTKTVSATLKIKSKEEEGLLTIAGVSFEDKTVDYSGSEHSITVSGLPEDASVAYTANTGTNPGVYYATAVITKEGYKTLTLQATLTINKLTFTGVTFQNVSVVYDNNEHTISVAGVPNFANVTYTGTRTAKNAGTYNSTAKVTADNYHDLTLTATLTISKATLGDFIFNSSTFEYDTQKYIISISGLVPSGETVVYSGGEDGANGATNVGTYTITAVIGGKNYFTKTVSATLKIKSKEEPLATIIYAGDVYFQNALDNNKLYVYNGSEVEKVNNDIPESFVTYGDSLYYLTKNLFTKGITSYDGTSFKDLFTVSGEYLVSDGINVFYSVTSILKPSVNGIYRLALADLNNQSEDPVATRVCEIKAEYLTIINGYIYFTNNSDSGKLYRIDSSVTEGMPEKVYDYKVSDLTASGNILYFTRHITLTNLTPGAAIYSIDTANLDTLPISEEEGVVTKITNSKGKYITVVGEYVYFVNTDLITSTIFGNGIYKAKADGSDWLDNVIGGTKVINAEDNNVYALSTDGVNLYYYRANNKHLYCYNISSDEEVDLMEGFVPPEETVLITTYYAEMKEYNNELYYIKMTDGGKLYKYNIESGQETRVTNLEVADFAINDGILYYATVRFKVNFDLYKMDLVTGENTRISTEKCMHFAFDENYLYYGSFTFTDNNTLNRMNFDGTEVEILFDTKSVDDYDIYALNGKIYFVADGEMYCYDTEADLASIVNNEAKPNEFIVIDGSAYLMQDSSKNSFSKLDLATGELTQIDDLGWTNDARSFFVIGNYIYYYRNAALGSADKGLYKIDMTSSEPQGTLVTDLVDGDTSFYMSSAVAIGQKVYFLDVWQVKNSIPTPQSTASLCVLDLTDNTVTVLAE